MNIIELSGEVFLKAITILKSMIGKGKKVNPSLKCIQLHIEQGVLWGYSSNGCCIVRVKICNTYAIEDTIIVIEVPKILPARTQKVKIELDKDNDSVKLEFGNISIEYKQPTIGNSNFRNLYDQVNIPYLKTAEDKTSNNKRINDIYINPLYLSNITNAMAKCCIPRMKLEVEDSNKRALRITADGDNIEVYILPMRPDNAMY